MPATRLEHFTVRCEDLQRTRDFYCEIVGLTEGQRPNLPFRGFWLYAGEVPVVHLMDKAEAEKIAGESPCDDPHTAALDHVAFSAEDLTGTRSLLQAHGYEFRENSIPGFLDQIFLRDPDGILVELNFRAG